MLRLSATLLSFALCSPLLAQTLQTLPQGYLTQNGDAANHWPWSNTQSAGHRCMWIYDSSHIKHPGRILISRLRWRATATASTWQGGTHPNVTINLSTARVDYQMASATYAQNHGQDMKAVFQGTVTVTPSTHKNGRWYVEVNLKTPFLYDPSKGDLVIDVIRVGAPTGNFVALDHVSDNRNQWRTKSNRIQSYNTPSSPTGSVGPYGAITEIAYTPANGLYSAFSATPTEGKSPLKVQFTDKTFTSAGGGVQSWAWDFDGDNKTDSTLQNPSWTFTGTGWDKKFSVSLTTTDGTHPASKVTLTDYITVNPFPIGASESFGAGTLTPAKPGPIEIGALKGSSNSSGLSYGYYFRAPTTLVVTGLRVPHDTPQPLQAVALFTMPQAPPAYSATYAVPKVDVKFFAQGAASNTTLRPQVPVVILKDTWVGVLGGEQASTGTTMYCGLGEPGTVAPMLGHPVRLRCLTRRATLVGGDGSGPVSSQDTTRIGRVELFLAGHSNTPTLTTIGQPAFNETPQLDLRANVPGAQGGLVLLAPGRAPAPLPTPFGNLLIQPLFLASVFVPNGTGQLPITIPNDRNLAAVALDFQAVVFDVTMGVYGMSNGMEWVLGQK